MNNEKICESDIKKCIEYWKLYSVEKQILELENGFADTACNFKTKEDYENIQIFSLAHSIVVMKEIICLLKNGYPDGALARARRVYENMVILKYLDSKKTDNGFSKLVQRYFDNQKFIAYKNLIVLNELCGNEKGCIDFKRKLKKLQEEYALSENEKIDNYWWVKKSFNKLMESLNDPLAELLYKRA